MGENKEKQGFFKKIINVITGQPDSTPSSANDDSSRYAPQDKEPLDLRFVKKFTANGGHFVYCENESILLENIKNIALEEKIKSSFGAEDYVFDLLKQTNIDVLKTSKSSTCVFTTCEALVAFNGGIMIDDIQTGGHRLSELPKLHIVLGKTSQMVENLHAGMARINNKYRDKRPGQITTLKGPQDESVLQAATDHNANRTLYLLLLEDQIK